MLLTGVPPADSLAAVGSRSGLFDGELKKLEHTGRIEDLMTRQGELHDSLDAEIAELEKVVVELSPKDDEGEASPTRH